MNSASKGSTNDDRSDGQQERAFMIPGVDGKLTWGFPAKIITQLRYLHIIRLSSISGSISTNVYAMNSPFDPDVSGVGHQPMYYDTYAGIYQSYRVLGSRLRARFSPQPGATVTDFGPYVVGINGSPTSTTLSTTNTDRMEQSDAIYDIINREDTPVELDWTYSPEAKLGRPSGDDTVSAAIGSNPSQPYYAHVWIQDLASPATSNVSLTVEVQYTVEFFRLQQASQS